MPRSTTWRSTWPALDFKPPTSARQDFLRALVGFKTMNTNILSLTQAPQAKSFTRHFPVIARLLLGLFLLAIGTAGLFHVVPPSPPNLPEAAVAFNLGMLKTGYMFPLVAGTQALVGALLLLNRFVPLALALLAPFVVNALAFHLFLVPGGTGCRSHSSRAGALSGVVVSRSVLAHARRARRAERAVNRSHLFPPSNSPNRCVLLISKSSV